MEKKKTSSFFFCVTNLPDLIGERHPFANWSFIYTHFFIFSLFLRMSQSETFSLFSPSWWQFPYQRGIYISCHSLFHLDELVYFLLSFLFFRYIYIFRFRLKTNFLSLHSILYSRHTFLNAVFQWLSQLGYFHVTNLASINRYKSFKRLIISDFLID